MTSAEAAVALGWHALAGIDTLVTENPRNWLAAPALPAATVDRPRASTSVPGEPGAAFAAGADSRAASADSLAALTAALAEFAHPLRDPGAAPRLLAGNAAAGLWVVVDQPDAPDSPAERLRDRMLAAIGLGPADHALACLLPWPTTGGRPPRDEEVAAFAPFFARARALAPPRLILAFGDRAAGLSGPIRGFASARGRWLDAAGTPLLATFHPRILLAQPELKRLAWADLQAFAARIGSPR